MTTELSAYIELLTFVFLFGYWVGIFILLYHLIRFGVGTHPKRLALMLLIGSMLLTVFAILAVYRL